MKQLKKIIPFLITAFIFFLIFRKIDFNQFVFQLKNIDIIFLIFAMLYFFVYPIIGIERWRRMIKLRYSFSFFKALRIYFIGETLNLVLPSKAGDLSKAYFLKQEKIASFSYGLSTVLFEKILDLMALGIAFMFGLLFYFGKNNEYLSISIFTGIVFLTFFLILFFDKLPIIKSIIEKVNKEKLTSIYSEISAFSSLLRNTPVVLILLIIVSIVFWFGHLFHYWLFFQAAGIQIGFLPIVSYVPIAIIIGLVPITIAGMGTRDAVLLYLFSEFAAPEQIVAAGLLITLRYFVPALIGLPFIKSTFIKPDFLKQLKNEK